MKRHVQTALAAELAKPCWDFRSPLDVRVLPEPGAPMSAVGYIAIQADMAVKEGPVSSKLADLFMQLAQVQGVRTFEDWNALVMAAQAADSTIADVLEFGEDE